MNLKFLIMKIKMLWATIIAFISSLWKRADKLVHQIAPIAISVVEAVKKVNESVTGDIIEHIIESIIPGVQDDVIIGLIRTKLKDVLPKLIIELNIANSIANIEDPNEQIKAIINAINISPDETKNTYYHVLCTKIVEALSDGKLTWSESIHITEFYYSNIYKKK